MAAQLHIMIVPHTHWDREWYQTFQQFRIRLVRAVDKLLDILERDANYRYFMLDGQTIILDDYIEARPEQAERLMHFIRSKRILVGPWYIQPDEFLVSGESLIRNLQRGLRQAREAGNPMHIGYVPDTFGHIAQLPQILRGFNIDNAVFWRGVGDEARQSEFYWQAPDGSRVLVIHLADPLGYSNARQLPLAPQEFIARVELLAANLLGKASTDTLLFMNGSDHLEPQDGLPAAIEAANKQLAHLDPRHEELLLAASQRNQRNQQIRHNGWKKHYDSIVLEIGTLPQYIERVRQQYNDFETLRGEMRSSRYSPLLPAVLSTRMWIKQQNTAAEHLLTNWVEPLTAWAALLNVPYPRGLVDLAWRYLLQNQPHDSICGCSIDQVHRENRVRFAQCQQIGESLLAQSMQQITAHIDTRAPFPTSHVTYRPLPLIVFNPAPGPRTEAVQAVVQLPGALHNAVVVDERGEQVPYRVAHRWRQEIGSLPVSRETLAMAATLSGVTSAKQFMQMAQNMIATALGEQGEALVISHIYIESYRESSLHHVHYVPQPGVVHIEVMLAPAGRVIVNEQELTAATEHMLTLLHDESIHTLEITAVDQARETLEFLAADLPAYGYKTFWLYPRGLKAEPHEPREPHEPQREQREQAERTDQTRRALLASEGAIENEFYRVTVNVQDGTLTVTDKLTGAVFAGLNRFIDGGDVGDLYTYCPPDKDMLVAEPLEPVKVELVNAGPVRATLRISARMALPGCCTADRAGRSSRLTICPIVSEISLTPGVRRVDIHTSIDNRVKDHRLRVVFPVSYKVESSVAEGTFEVRSRPAALPWPVDVTEWAEEPVNTFPQKRFVDMSNGEIGLAVLNRGLPEYEVLQAGPACPGLATDQFALALTLLRCVEWLSRGDLKTRHGHAGPMEQTPEAQCLGQQEFDYALVPHSGDWQAEEALVLREAQNFNLPLAKRVIASELHEGRLASQAALVEIEPRELVLSALKRSNDGQGLVVRLYNPLEREVEAEIRLGCAFERVSVTNLLEEVQERLEHPGEGRPVRIHVGGGRIVTLLFDHPEL
ncbi:MAG: hypothetical protein IMW89_10100 [Ktedonobacteraceae bacterium]|nr:hypothetical protein [Ktedonobacteraceae bacterium]